MRHLFIREFRENRVYYILFFGLMLAHILLIFSLRILPFVDLPQHLAYATIYKHVGETGNHFNEFFEFVRLPFRFNSFHPIFCSMDIWGSVETGNKVFFAVYIMLLPLSVHLFIGKLGGNRWMTLLVFLLIYNYSVSWGFVGFILSIPLYLIILMVHYMYLNESAWSSTVLLPVLFILLYQMHLLSALLLLALVILQHVVWHFRCVKIMLVKGLVHLPILFMLLNGIFGTTTMNAQGSSSDSLLSYYKSEYWYSLIGRIKGIVHYDHHFLFEGFHGKLAGLVITLCILACLLIPIKLNKFSLSSFFQDRRRSYVLSMVLFFFLMYMTLWSIWGKGYTYPFRFNVLAFLSLIIFASLFSPVRHMKILKAVMPVMCLVYFTFWLHHCAAFQMENREFRSDLFAELPKDKVLSGLMFDAHFRGQPVYIHFADYFVTWHHGIETLNLAYGYPTYGMKTCVSEERLPRAFPWVSLYQEYDGHFDRSNYLLLRGKAPTGVMKKIDENFFVYRKRSPWILMQNRHLPLSLDRKEGKPIHD